MLPKLHVASSEISSPASLPAHGGGAANVALGPLLGSTALLAAAVVAIIYWDTFNQLRAIWDKDPSYSHGYLVPLASLGFAFLSWQRGRPELEQALTARGMASGTAEIVLGLGLHALAWLMTVLLLDVIALICLIRGLLLLLGGPSVNSKLGFAALFLIFMAPLPPPVYQAAALAMQHFVSVISTACLDLLGIAAFRQGYRIQLADNYAMEVGEACSGLSGMTMMLAVGAALGELFQSSRRVRTALLLLALPTAVVANCLRVTLSGIIMVWFGRQWAVGIYHVTEGLIVQVVAAAVLLCLALIMVKYEQSHKEEATVGPPAQAGRNT
jgi:exosortase